ncbi:MAG: hypothetical protein A2498_14325 [Lentisphaerae bacterium RIFOXYC12_FULL_60_16]|nr:MAG: hypothetical protein A2498_14325 [Lentisphaerae bacterium RIFOXYC12_FULL_60_16]
MAEFTIPGYELSAKIGKGGMGSVWKARQVRLDRDVAIKVFQPQFKHDAGDVDRFLNEAKIAARISHPAIVQIHDANIEGDLYYFVMEYVDGRTVRQWVNESGRLDEENVLALADAVSEALEYAWETERLIHCDIKPENIILTTGGAIKLVDLGLARTMQSVQRVGSDVEILGTPSYMSPEQVEGDPELDCRTDMYALGATLYHCVTGKALFAALDADAIMEQQLQGTVPDACDCVPDVSRGFCWFLETLLAKRRQDRYGDWSEVRRDLARVMNGQMPERLLPAAALSTMSRSAHRLPVQRPGPAVGQDVPDGGGEPLSRLPMRKLWAISGVVALLLCVVAFILWNSGRRKAPPPKAAVVTPVKLPVPQEEAAGDSGAVSDAIEPYTAAQQWIEENPDFIEAGLERMEAAAQKVKGTRYEVQANQRLAALKTAGGEKMIAVMRALSNQVANAISAGHYLDAAAIYEQYDGAFARGTEPQRKRLAVHLRGLHADAERKRQEQAAADLARDAAFNGALRTALTQALGEDVPGALAIIDAVCARWPVDDDHALSVTRRLLTSVADLDRAILESFKEEKGKVVTVSLAAGKRSLLIDGVIDDQVQGMVRAPGGQEQRITFKVVDLAPGERLKRLGPENLPEVAFAKGTVALRFGDTALADQYFSKVPAVVSEAIQACMSGK